MKEPPHSSTREGADAAIQQLEKQIADLKRRWPAHSVPPAMLEQLDELEEELQRLQASSRNQAASS